MVRRARIVQRLDPVEHLEHAFIATLSRSKIAAIGRRE
jgi:hypothetical protein